MHGIEEEPGRENLGARIALDDIMRLLKETEAQYQNNIIAFQAIQSLKRKVEEKRNLANRERYI